MKKRLVAGMAAASLLAGCSPAGGSGPTPTSAAPSSTQSSVAAPRVADPLPSSVFDKHPCDSALTTDQIKQLLGEVPPARHTDNQAGPGCGWTKVSTTDVVDVAWLTGVRGGLGQMYAASQNDAFHEPTTVDGYPGLFWNPDAQPTQACSLAVAINDDLVFNASLNEVAVVKTTPCDGAMLVARKVLASLRGAAGK